MKLYYSPRTRAHRPRWLLEELGVPYELVRFDRSKREHKAPEYLKIHPHGAVPALVDGELTLIESAAICMYLADKFPEKGLAPASGTPERGSYYQWIAYAVATMEPPLFTYFMNTVMLPEEKRSTEQAEQARKAFLAVMPVLSAAIAGKEYLVGDRFTVADLMVSSMLGWAAMVGLLSNDFPDVKQYSKRLANRPAAKRAQAD